MIEYVLWCALVVCLSVEMIVRGLVDSDVEGTESVLELERLFVFDSLYSSLLMDSKVIPDRPSKG